MKYRYFLLPTLLLCLLQTAQAQVYPLGQNPLPLRFGQLSNERYQVVYPVGLEQQAGRVARLVDHLYAQDSNSIGNRREKVTIFLQNQTTIPNGFVALAPFRSEFFMTAPQYGFAGTTQWADLLTIHEYRHVQQFVNAKRGITSVFSTLFGEMGWAMAASIALPRWFLEGDAIIAETALSPAGRGRMPDFEMQFKALSLAGRLYRYEKTSAGSFRHFVPDHYVHGYYLTAYARQQFGKDIWKETTGDAARYRGLLFPLSTNLKRRTGWRTPELHRQTFRWLDSTWQAGRISAPPVPALNTAKKHTFTNYRTPRYLADGELVASKSSFRQIRTFTRLLPESGQEAGAGATAGPTKERAMFKPGINNGLNQTLSAKAGKLAWAEQTYGIRRGYEDFSILRVYDQATGERRKLTSRSRLFAPDLSPDGQQVVAVRVTPLLENALVVLDAQTGAELHTWPAPENAFLSHPHWAEWGILTVGQTTQGQGILHTDPATGASRWLLAPAHIQLSFPFAAGKYVLFSGAHSGTHNIMALDSQTGQLWQVTQESLGAFEPALSPDGTRIAYSAFSAQGYDIRQIPFAPSTWTAWNGPAPAPRLATLLTGQERVGTFPPLTDSIPTVAELPRPARYNTLSGLLNLHSWRPLVFHPEYTLQLLADNKFRTLSARAAATWNANEENVELSASVIYAQLFPVIDVQAARGLQRARNFPLITQPTDTTLQLQIYRREWDENRMSAGILLPFHLTHGNYFSRLDVASRYRYLNLSYTDERTDRRANGSAHAMEHSLRFSRLQARAHQHIVPRWGQLLQASWQRTIGGNPLSQGEAFSADLTLFFPGLLRTHGLYFVGAMRQEKATSTYKFPDTFFYSRGYGAPLYDQIRKFSANYTLPLLYPDVALGPIAFLKRIKANLYYDHSVTTLTSIGPFSRFFPDTFRSVGIDLTFDVRLFRLTEADFGVRYSYLLDQVSPSLNRHQWNFLLLSFGF